MNYLDTIIWQALKEDVGSGDVTSKAVVPQNLRACAKIVAKEDMILAGVNVAVKVFKAIDKAIKIKIKKRDGKAIKKGTEIAEIRGNARSLLAGERTALNFLQHLSGIATLTHKFVEASISVRHLQKGAAILDTRKTVPGLRLLEKYAVKMGGGRNHRIGLYDMYLIKNNHVDIAGGVKKAILECHCEAAKRPWQSHEHTRLLRADALAMTSKRMKIEVEVRNLKEFREALEGGADIIMLDNFSPKMAKMAIKLVKKTKKRPKIEISGNISLKNIKKYAKLGADYISIGAITHSARAMDIHMVLYLPHLTSPYKGEEFKSPARRP